MHLKSGSGPISVLVLNDDPPAITTPTSHTFSLSPVTGVPSCSVPTSSVCTPAPTSLNTSTLSPDIRGLTLLTQQATTVDAEQRHAPSLNAADITTPPNQESEHPLNSALSMEEIIQDVIESNMFPINAQQTGKGADPGGNVPMEEGVSTPCMAGASGSGLADAMDLSDFDADSTITNSAVLAALRSLVEVMNEQEQRKRVDEAMEPQRQQGETWLS